MDSEKSASQFESSTRVHRLSWTRPPLCTEFARSDLHLSALLPYVMPCWKPSQTSHGNHVCLDSQAEDPVKHVSCHLYFFRQRLPLPAGSRAPSSWSKLTALPTAENNREKSWKHFARALDSRPCTGSTWRGAQHSASDCGDPSVPLVNLALVLLPLFAFFSRSVDVLSPHLLLLVLDWQVCASSGGASRRAMGAAVDVTRRLSGLHCLCVFWRI